MSDVNTKEFSIADFQDYFEKSRTTIVNALTKTGQVDKHVRTSGKTRLYSEDTLNVLIEYYKKIDSTFKDKASKADEEEKVEASTKVLEDKLNQLEEEMNRLKEENNVLRVENSGLTSESKAQQKHIDDLNAQNKWSKQELEKRNQQTDNFQVLIGQKTSELQAMNSQLQEVSQEKDQLKLELDKSKTSFFKRMFGGAKN